jgi:putative ABC transport system substrate-binding protein
VILTGSNLATAILGRQTRTIPIVFGVAGDAVGTGLVPNMADPGGNITGFTAYEVAIGGKRLGLLKELAPQLKRVAVVYTQGGAGSEGQLHSIEDAAPSFEIRTTAIPTLSPSQIEHAISAFSEEANSGLVSLTGPGVSAYREQIIAAAARNRLPAIYSDRFFVTGGGILSYAPDYVDLFRRAASYVDRILRGEKPGDLPVQAPTKIRIGHQPQDRQATRPHRATNAVRLGKRGDRMIKRREIITLLGGAAAWPLAARAQQGDRVRRIGVLIPGDENAPAAKTFVSEFPQALSDLGWTDGRNVQIDLRWAGVDINRIRALAQELVGLQPDIILAITTPTAAALQRETRTIPIVFVNVSDPVASGIIPRLNQPGGNITGFAVWEASLGGKWLELLSEITPGLKRAAIMFNPDTAPALVYMPSLETAAQSLKVLLIPAPVHSDAEIETAIIALGREPGAGLVIVPDVFFTPAHSASIILAAARNNVPAVYSSFNVARNGGLLSYGPDQVDTNRRAASYVDRILRGAKPGDLPVQFPTKF